MARKTLEVKIDAEGRDKGKTFFVTEKPAAQAEKWAMKALALAARSGVDLGNISPAMGIQGVAALGVMALMNAVSEAWDEAESLLDEMMTCVQIKETSGLRDLMGDDIEEVATRIELRKAVLELHVGFSLAGKGSK